MCCQYGAVDTGRERAPSADRMYLGEMTMDKKKPRDVTVETALQKRKEETENYAEHLARVTPDANSSKALLQARFKELHDIEHDDTNTD
jgi:hypothetical protein